MKRINTIIKHLPQVENLRSSNGNDIPNQYRIITPDGVIFQSYSSIIAVKTNDGRVVLDRATWDYSNTTGKYRNQFLNETKKETQSKIDAGIYKLADLN